MEKDVLAIRRQAGKKGVSEISSEKRIPTASYRMYQHGSVYGMAK